MRLVVLLFLTILSFSYSSHSKEIDAIYSKSSGKEYVGKRIIFSFRHINTDGSQEFEGLWGIVVSAEDEGLVIKVEGGNYDYEYWVMPPDLTALEPAKNKYYEFDDETIVEGVDFESYWITSDQENNIVEELSK